MQAQSRQQAEGELLKDAALGDLASLRELTARCVGGEYAGVGKFELMAFAEAFGRLAATHGEDWDNLLLAAILRVRASHLAELGDVERGVRLVAQSEAICDQFPSVRLSPGAEYLAGLLTAWADEGDELAAARLNKLSAALSASDADKLRRDVNEACGAVREEALR